MIPPRKLCQLRWTTTTTTTRVITMQTNSNQLYSEMNRENTTRPLSFIHITKHHSCIATTLYVAPIRFQFKEKCKPKGWRFLVSCKRHTFFLFCFALSSYNIVIPQPNQPASQTSLTEPKQSKRNETKPNHPSNGGCNNKKDISL